MDGQVCSALDIQSGKCVVSYTLRVVQEGLMTTVAQAAAELDINERVIVSALLSNPDPALYNTQTGEISKQGMELLRERIITPDEMRSAIMTLVRGSAEK